MPTNNNKDAKGGRHSSSSYVTSTTTTSEERDAAAAAAALTSTATDGRKMGGRVGTKKNDGKNVDRLTSTSPPVDADANLAGAAAVKPGAVAVHGGQSSYLARGDDGGVDDDVDVEGASPSPSPAMTPHHPRTAAGSDSPVVVVDSSYIVVASEVPMNASSDDVDDEDEEIRRRILANTAHAEQVTDFDATNKDAMSRRRRQQQCWIAAIIALLIVVVAAIAVGIAVPLSRNASSGSGAAVSSDNTDDLSSPIHDPSVVAALSYIEWQGSGGFAYSVRAETRQTNVLGDTTTTTTSGVVEIVGCKPKPCTVSDDACIVGKFYEPGCCAGSNCTNNATKCGDSCRPAPTSCYLTDPTNRTCVQPDCYTCHKVGGEDVYVLQNIAFAIDCLQVGTSIRPDNNETYQWAIFCGPMIAGPIVEENRGLGQYQCGAFRQGANYSDDVGGLGMEAANYPCVYLALAQCGCGPSNMYTFGLPAPTGPCEPIGSGGNRTCPLLCEDVGTTYAKNLCHSFPGNISYWDGANAFNSTLFYEGLMAPQFQLDIYIKD